MNMINKELLIQLPKHHRYHVFQTDSNVLNFVRDDINKSIVQLHEKLSNVGYMDIPTSSIKFKNTVSTFGQVHERREYFCFKHGLQVGEMVWLVENNYVTGIGDHFLLGTLSQKNLLNESGINYGF